MSEKPHSAAIGAFVAGALLIGVTAVLFALGTGFGSNSNKFVMVFEGSVKGLNMGAPVALRGVQVGQVTKIELVLDSETSELITLVEAEISGDNLRRTGAISDNLVEDLIERGMRAQLNTQSLLTGLLYVQLDFHPDSEINLADIDSPYQQIPSIPTGLEKLTRELESLDLVKMANDMETIATGLAEFVGDEKFKQLPGQLHDTVASVQALSEQLQGQVDSTGGRLDALLSDANGTVDLANEELPELARLIRSNLEMLEQAIATIESSAKEFQHLVDYDSNTVYELNRALQDLGKAGRSLQSLGRTLEEHPESLIRGRSED
ncbi:MCE family protein [Mangrovimicrobium sediminis]|uniref:MCE family protein n=1 Tax=Mangrovimicrobium sediminis TaxID=2562682 RepID=A0A4Z0LXL4_9GAMM|nr:MlaD family protein [Haliea sp. SAOS-164]TGD72072.1 MCE family protein [Haliea sp. SAOS-164]